MNSGLDLDQSMVHIVAMDIPISEAKGKLTDLVRRAEAGDDIVLTRHGRPAAKLVAVRPAPADHRERAAIIERIVRGARAKIAPGPDAARSQDLLYDPETGRPA
ncbi:type II toxin-antitoxin system Phd/YefM family antitoxin [Sphingosinicella ginsenosidimutans]|nr:type II toxin-antitoxin system prevent-host-death family antitoxin [Sphingosinicella ginsenosidimutans]